MENKQVICDALKEAINLTREHVDSLVYERVDGCTEYVTITFAPYCTRKVNVSMDSGIAMIRDIMKHID